MSEGCREGEKLLSIASHLLSSASTAKEEFFAVALRETFYESVETLQSDFDGWLIHYNTERPHQGYRNLGKRPIDTINVYLQPVRKEA
jgi:hypothetical protein